MEPRVFLEKALSENGYYCVFAAKSTENKRTQKFYTSISAVIDSAQRLDADGFDAYFALATFEEDNSRKVANVKELKAFFLDLDCGPSKDYPNQSEALDALRMFCSATKLPKPFIMDSGRGVHAYWFLDEPITYDDWLPVAEKLKALCATHNLLADPAVTADAARVLRVPGTRNHKDSPPPLVKQIGMNVPDAVSLEVFSNTLGMDMMPPPTKYVPAGASAVMDALIGNKTSVFLDILNKTRRGAGCAQLASIMKKQAEVPEPLWRAGLSIAKFCEDGDKAAHRMSKNHPQYTPIETVKKLDLIKGPYRCARFDEYAPGVCTGCPHWGKIKSPIVLGQKIREATEEEEIVVEANSATLPNNPLKTYTIPTYPTPYFRGANGGVYVRKTEPDGTVDEIPVYHNDLYVVKRISDPEVGESILMRLHLPKDGVREFTIPLTSVTSRDEFRKQMSMQGVAVPRVDELMKYTLDWVNELQSKSEADEAHKQFGWVGTGFDSFILGNQHILENDVDFNPPSSQTLSLFPAFEPKGTMEQWRKNMDFYNRENFELHQYVVGTAFGSVLMQDSPFHCATLHLHGTSGIGKTTAMIVGASLWGSPDEIVMDQNTTFNFRMHRGEIYHNLPFYLDEITESKPWEISQLAYGMSNGKQRGRLAGSANAERYRGDPWKFLSVTTGNASVIERVSAHKAMPKAEAQRIMEIKVDKLFLKSADTLAQEAFLDSVKANYGHAGPKFIQHVIQNKESIRSLTDSIKEKVISKAGLTSENRFWTAHVSYTLAGLILAKRIGFHDYDIQKIFKFAIWMLKTNLNSVSDMSLSVQDILNDYMNEHWNNVLWIKSTDDLRKGQGGALDSLIVPEASPRGKLVARYETDIKKAYLHLRPLRNWCVDQQINYGSLLQDLTEQMNAKKIKMRLSKGTPLKLPPADVLAVECALDVPDEVQSSEEE
tara:strand:- start:291 stop:3116 length:2826 start_codon:yes stop_codon:yes gene_type:complete